MSSSSGPGSTSKYKKNKQASSKESNTLDNKHRLMVKYFNEKRSEKDELIDEIDAIIIEIKAMDERRDSFTLVDIKNRASLLDKKEQLEHDYNSIKNNFDEMDYYDNAGDLISDYYEMRDNKEIEPKETKNIMEFLCKKEKIQIMQGEIKPANRANLFEKYCQRVEGIRVVQDDGSNRIKYCDECKIEKILDISENEYICPCYGNS